MLGGSEATDAIMGVCPRHLATSNDVNVDPARYVLFVVPPLACVVEIESLYVDNPDMGDDNLRLHVVDA